ncbi:MAG: hypothetical protein AABY75_07465 [Bacteroidota bacterium]
MKPSRAFFFLAIWSAAFSTAPAQETPSNPDENLAPDQVTEILKQEWTFLKEETDAFLKETETRGEFETTPEFGKRVAARRQIYLANLATHIKDQKLDTRNFGVLLKARLVSYNADKQAYAVACSVAVQAPYDIPSLVSFIPTNPYVVMQDTVVGGYRTNRMLMKFKPHWTWPTERATAMEAKADEASIFFRIRFTIDINQPAIKNQALLRIIPKGVEFINVNRQAILWHTAIP